VFARLFRKCLSATIVVSLTASFFPALFAQASTDDVRWSPVSLPAEGIAGGWALAAGADTRYLTAAIDGTLYCYATPAGTTDRLFKSMNGGLSWSSTGRVKDAIIGIATSPFDAATVYYATVARVYRSTDAGISFIALPPNPGGAGSGNMQITSLDVARTGAGNLVAVATRDTDAGQFGGVYVLDESSLTGVWQDVSIGNYDVLRVAFSPCYAIDRALYVIATDETDTVVRTRIANGNWGQMLADTRLTGTVPVSAAIAFPPGYQPQGSYFITINTGVNRGDACKVTPLPSPGPSLIARLGIGAGEGLSGMDISNMVVTGEAGTTLVAGCGRQAVTYTSLDGGAHWTPCQKRPTGQTEISLALSGAPGQQKLCAVTCGTESAFSISVDGGMTWNQVSLIDTKISSLVDFAVMPATDQAPLFLITHSNDSLKRSLWRSPDGGTHWQRIFNASLPGVDTFNLVATTADGALFLAGQSSGAPVLWQSTDLGQTFVTRMAPCAVTSWAFADRNTFFVGGYDGSKGIVYHTGSGGLFQSEPAEIGTRNIASIALSPGYPQDRTIAVGNTGGQVFLSTDNGTFFTPLGQQLPVSAGVGNVSVIFDRNFSKNGNIYAAVDAKTTTTSKERIFRFSSGRSTAWQGIAGSLPVDALVRQVSVTEGDVMYAVNNQPLAAADAKGGVLRCINPASATPSWETILGGLDEGVTLSGLWSYHNQLWSLDTKNNALITITDTLTAPVNPGLPADGVSGLGTDVRLEWQAVSGATAYEWQVSDETSFGSLPAGFSGTAASSSARTANLNPATTYYWRVRVTSPYRSPWSAVRSFTTLIGGANVAPALNVPQAGSKTAVAPVFQWTPVAGADRYELIIATDTTFASPTVMRASATALTANAWQCETSLQYGTTYFWKVRACTATNAGEWSAVSVFITESAPSLPVSDGSTDGSADLPAPAAQTQPAALLQQVTILPPQTQAPPLPTPITVEFPIPAWAIYSGLALLLVIAVLLVILVVVFIKKRP